MATEPTSTKPYLLRALYEWCVDNGFTPYLQVVVDKNTMVPKEYIKNGEIVLNIGPLASNKLRIGNEQIEFQARFGGIARDLFVPIPAVAAIYAKENGQGMSFEHRLSDEPATVPRGPTIVGGSEFPAEAKLGKRTRPESDPPDPPPAPPAPPAPSAPSGRPALRRVK
jgi:stringent starvation protein B